MRNHKTLSKRYDANILETYSLFGFLSSLSIHSKLTKLKLWKLLKHYRELFKRSKCHKLETTVYLRLLLASKIVYTNPAIFLENPCKTELSTEEKILLLTKLLKRY